MPSQNATFIVLTHGILLTRWALVTRCLHLQPILYSDYDTLLKGSGSTKIFLTWRWISQVQRTRIYRGTPVFIVTRLCAGQPGFDSRRTHGFFSLLPGLDLLWGPASLLHKGYRRVSPQGVKQPGRNDDNHLHLLSRLGMRGTTLTRSRTISWRCA
jgi:hypothetical protein